MTLCRCSGVWSQYLATRTWARRLGPGRPRSIGNDGGGAWVMVSHCRQLILGRTWTTTLKCEGTYSSTSRSSAPTRVSAVLPHVGQAHAGSYTTRSRGRCAGNGCRPRVRRSLVVEGRGSTAASRRACCAAASSSRSLISSSSCSIRSEERPKRARFMSASVARSFSMCSVFAWISASRAASSRSLAASASCSEAASARRAWGSEGSEAVADGMSSSTMRQPPWRRKDYQIRLLSYRYRARRQRRRHGSPPVDGFDQQGQLGRGQEQRAVDDGWPDEPAPLQPLGEQAEAGAIPIQDLQVVHRACC